MLDPCVSGHTKSLASSARAQMLHRFSLHSEMHSDLHTCHRELFRKGNVDAAMMCVKRGYDEMGYAADRELAAQVIEQLTKAGLKVCGVWYVAVCGSV